MNKSLLMLFVLVASLSIHAQARTEEDGTVTCNSPAECETYWAIRAANLQKYKVGDLSQTAVGRALDGHFTKFVFRKVTDSKFGTGWVDPSGLIWVDYVKHGVNQAQSREFCGALGARVPTKGEFEMLGFYMGATTYKTESNPKAEYNRDGFWPQVFLPKDGEFTYWTSTHDESPLMKDAPYMMYTFTQGEPLALGGSADSSYYDVRCVK